MWLEKIWITIATIVAISINNALQAQFQNSSEPESEHLKVETIKKKQEVINHTDNNTQLNINYGGKTNLRNVLFGDIIANSMKQILPYSLVNMNCTRDGQQFFMGLNNHTKWAVQSKSIINFNYLYITF